MNLMLRQADTGDAGKIWEWRNDPQTRAMSRSTEPVTWEAHNGWFNKKLTDADTLILIASDDSERVGVVRLDGLKSALAHVSINLSPMARGRGIGAPLVIMACDFAERYGFAGAFAAEIRQSHAASIRTFEHAGFILERQDEGWVYYRRAAPTGKSEVDNKLANPS